MMRNRLRKLTGVLLALVMVLSLLPATAMAADDVIRLGGVVMHSGDYLVEGATTTTDAAPTGGEDYAYYKDGVLTLHGYDNNNAVYSVDNNPDTTSVDYNYALYAPDDLTIKVTGGSDLSVDDPHVDYWNYVIYVSGDLTIEVDDDCYFNLNGRHSSDGICASGDVTIKGMEVSIYAEEDGIDADSADIQCLSFWVEADYPFWTDYVPTFDEGLGLYPYVYDGAQDCYFLQEYTSDRASSGFYDAFGVWVPDPIYVTGVEMKDGDYLKQGASAVTSVNPGNNYAHYEDGVLTLKNFTYAGAGAYNLDDQECYDIINTMGASLRIHLIGENALMETGIYDESGGYALTSWYGLAISGEADASLKLLSADGDALYSDGYFSMLSGNLVTAGSDEGTYLNHAAQYGGMFANVGDYRGLSAEAFSMVGGQFASAITAKGLQATSISRLYIYNETYELSAGQVTGGSDAVVMDVDDYLATEPNYAYMQIVQAADVTRIYGRSRYDTAFASADVLKLVYGMEKFDAVIVTNGENFADALAGSYLATALRAPILLTDNDNMADVLEYIDANLADGGMVYALGGTAVVSDQLKLVEDLGFQFKRLAGSSRFETNLAILDEVRAVYGTEVLYEPVLVCTAYNFADSLSASALGMPILLVDDTISDAQMDWLLEHSNGEFILVGGTGAVKPAVENQLAAIEPFYMERLAGSNRFETSRLVAEWMDTYYGRTPLSAALAYGYNFPDGLCAGPLAYALGAPLLLTATGDEVQPASYTRDYGLRQGVVLGGPALISDESVKAIFSMTDAEEIAIFNSVGLTAMVNDAVLAMK